MYRYRFILLIALGILAGCMKDDTADPSGELYTRSLDQIKKSLKGSWDLRSDCTVTIAGLHCRDDIHNEKLIFSETDSLFWTKENETIKKDKIEFKRITAGSNYKTDRLFVFKFAKDTGFYFPYDIRHDSLIIQSTIDAVDAGGSMIFTRSK